MIKTAITLALLSTTGCFIDELPNYKDDGSGVVGAAPPIKSLALGTDTTCAVLMTGQVRCWGSQPQGLDPSFPVRAFRPVTVKTLSNVEALAITGTHGCVLIAGVVSCFGSDEQGEIGNGTITHDKLALTPSTGATGVVQVLVANAKSGARTSDGSLLQWGAGAVGVGQVMPSPVEGGPAATIDYSRGDDHDCAVLSGGTVQCWGWNSGGQLGRGTVPSQQTFEMPAPVVNITDATRVIAGYTTCALHATGEVSCWGGGYLNPPTGTPTLISGLTSVQQLAYGSNHMCALMTGGTVACIGNNSGGELGIGEGTPSSMTPVNVPGLSGIVEIAAGGASTCARSGDNDVFCWGRNLPGDGSMMGSFVPTQVRW
jgi:alpha-tubulin suppressor-like RCC1 family protein